MKLKRLNILMPKKKPHNKQKPKQQQQQQQQKAHPYLAPHPKIDHRPKCKSKNQKKTSRRKHKRNCLGPWLGQSLFSQDTKIQTTKGKNE